MHNNSKIYGYILGLLSVSLLLNLAQPFPLKAQQQIMGPSTHMTDIKSLFANPALVSSQRPRFGTGIQAYHIGLVDGSGIPLTQGFATVSTPTVFGKNMGAGLNIQYFNSPIYRRTHFGLAASTRIFRYISLGGQVSGMNISYNRDNFDLVDPNDPVFMNGTGKTVLNSTAGLFSQPFEFLGLALGVRNLNEPNISLIGSDVKEPREFFGGLSLKQGLFRGSFELIKGRNNLDGMLHLEIHSARGNYVRAGGNHKLDQGFLEGQVHVSGPLSLNYQYTLPISSVLGPSLGSHMFSLLFEFRRVSKLPASVSPPRNRAAFERPLYPLNLEGRVFITSEDDYLRIFEKHITRHIDPGVSDQALANVSLYDMGVFDSSFVDGQISYPTEQIVPVPSQIQFQNLISSEYTKFIQDIGRGEHKGVSVISEQKHMMRAAGLHNRIQREGQNHSDRVMVETPIFNSRSDSLLFRTPAQRNRLATYEELTLLEPKTLRLSLYTSELIATVLSWKLIITNQDDEIIKAFNGSGEIPSDLNWDWMNDHGEIITPGVYTYQLSWNAADGVTHLSNQRKLFVQKTQRKITLQITDDPDKMPTQPDQIRILIKH
ncbi:MAG: type IX secretion system membrane protein PorP/SprF [Balneolales bacterium]